MCKYIYLLWDPNPKGNPIEEAFCKEGCDRTKGDAKKSNKCHHIKVRDAMRLAGEEEAWDIC